MAKKQSKMLLVSGDQTIDEESNSDTEMEIESGSGSSKSLDSD
jgi:hypothetical protein